MSGLICAGDVYLNQYVNGSLIGAVGPINCTKFALSPGKAESLDRISYKRDTFGQALDSVVFPGVSNLSIETDDAAAEILNYALLGTLTDIADSQGTVTNEAITARLGKWVKLANRNVASVVVTDDASPTPEAFTLSDDYLLDATAGMIFCLAAGDIDDGEILHVDYNFGARSGKQIIAATQNEIRAQIRLDGKNLATQQKVEILVHEAVLVPSGELDVAGKKFVTFGLSGSLVTPAGQSGPFIIREITDTAYTP
jgi:hypothetical protein